MDELFDALRRNFGEFRKRFESGIKEDLQRSTTEAKALLELGQKFATDAAKEGLRISEELAVEVKVERSLVLRQLQKQMMSDEFERHLDDILAQTGKSEEFAASQPVDAAWFAKIHASLYKDPFDGPDGEASRARRDRIGRKLAFLFRFYKDGVLGAAKKGALFGGLFGVNSALRLALVAGGLKLMLVLGGVTYSILIKENGEVSFA